MIGWIVQERPYQMTGQSRWVMRSVDRETPKMFFCDGERVTKDNPRVSQLLTRDEAGALLDELEDVYGHELVRAEAFVKFAKGQAQRLTVQSRNRMKSFLAESSDPSEDDLGRGDDDPWVRP